MAKRAWTEGPWTAEKQSEGAGFDWLILGPNGNEIAILFAGSQEDANLIAAAPDLYEALETVLHALDGLNDRGAALMRGLAAIKKAEG